MNSKSYTLDLAALGIHPEWNNDIPQCVTTCPHWDKINNECPLSFESGKICEPAVAEMRRCFVSAQLAIANLTVENVLLRSEKGVIA